MLDSSRIREAYAISNHIPHLYHHTELEPLGAWRLCYVEIGDGDLVPSCLTPVELGMVVSTKSAKVDRAVRAIVELLIADHHSSCRGCPTSGNCALQKIMAHFRIDRRSVRRLRPPQEELPLDNINPNFDYDPNRCVLCGICVQTCESLYGVGLLYFMDRGNGGRVGLYGDTSKCESCSVCVARCPVGALVSKKAEPSYPAIK
jgi:NADH dehydrogenase/NADH:ubiquinone oxidoreductase subunit G